MQATAFSELSKKFFRRRPDTRRVERPSVLRSKTLPQGEFISPEDVQFIRVPAKAEAFVGRAKKKMRSLGTVQVPTEAFLAVLKRDE